MSSHPGDHDEVERGVGVAIAAAAESVPAGCLPAGCGLRSDAAEPRECAFAGESVVIVACGDQHLCGDFRSDTVEGAESRSGRDDELAELTIELFDLVVEERPAVRQLA